MKIKINGEEKEMSILYGTRAKFVYESVAKMAGFKGIAAQDAKVICRVGDWSCELTPGQSVEIDVNEVPEFEVKDQSPKLSIS